MQNKEKYFTFSKKKNKKNKMNMFSTYILFLKKMNQLSMFFPFTDQTRSRKDTINTKNHIGHLSFYRVMMEDTRPPTPKINVKDYFMAFLYNWLQFKLLWQNQMINKKSNTRWLIIHWETYNSVKMRYLIKYCWFRKISLESNEFPFIVWRNFFNQISHKCIICTYAWYVQ